MTNTEIIRQKKFRNAVGGYKKEDVNQFIKETDLAYSQKEQEWNIKLNTLEEELTALKEQKASMEEELNSVRNALLDARKSEADSKNKIEEQIAEIQDMQKHIGIYKDQANAQNLMIENLKKETADAKENLIQAEAMLSDTKKQLEQATSQLFESKQREAYFVDAMNDFRQKWEQAEEESTKLKETSADTEAENENSAHKLEMYDKISSQIGDILLNANRNADEILAAAKDEAEKLRTDAALEAESIRNDAHTEVLRIRSETEEEANYIRERLSETANKLLSQISNDMHVNIDNCIKEVNTCIQEMQYDTEHMLSILKNRYHEMNERIQYYQTCVTDSVSKKLCDMDEKYGIRQENADTLNTNA